MGDGPLADITCVRGDVFVVSDATGDVLPGGAHGLYVRDTRFLDRLEVSVDGRRPLHLSGGSTGPASAAFLAHVPAAGPDPVLLVDRRRVVDESLHEEVRLINHGREPLDVELGLRVGTDFAYVFDVRHARLLDPAPPEPVDGGVRFVRDDRVDDVVVTTDPAPDRREGDRLLFSCHLAPGGSTRTCVDVTATDVYGTVRPRERCEAIERPATSAAGRPRRDDLSVHCSDHRFSRLLARSLNDIEALKMRDPQAPRDRFCAAGSPWYLTLFGRDSLWAAFMAVPYDLDLAAGTLRTLARRQGTRHDVDTEEAPGKILHEIRRGSLTHRGDLPPNYYGTIDATPLFVVLAHEAWRWGLGDDEVRGLLPHVEAALGWMRRQADPDGDGFLRYLKVGARGLDNQGWKDSRDGIQFADGALARPPIALSEVQGYAHDAAVRGAELLEAFDRPDVAWWRKWAAALAGRFRDRFWIDDEHGRYPATALDRDGRPVDGPASNMGHLPATGLLDAAEAGHVAAQLCHTRLASGWGLRTLATTAAGFNPLGYHAGTVWPHDTAIAAWGMAVSGHRDAAAGLLRGVVDAAPAFGYRLPELFGGFARQDTAAPVPYPAACRPQAWAAGGALLLLRACLGLQAELPGGRLTVAPLWPPPFRTLEVRGLPVAGRRLAIRVDDERGVDVEVDGDPLDVEVLDVRGG